VPLVLGAAFVTFIIVFAFQTWFLVDWLFPSTNLFMKVGTVGSFDVMSIIWAAADTFYEFYRWRSKHIVQAMWGITFTLATVCSIIQLYLASSTRLDFKLDPNIIHLSYALVILSLVGNLIALTFVFKIEWAASHPSRVVEDDEVQDEEDFSSYSVDEVDTEDDLDPVPQLTAPRARQVERTQVNRGPSMRSKGIKGMAKRIWEGDPQEFEPAQNHQDLNEKRIKEYEVLERTNRAAERSDQRDRALQEEARRRVDAQERDSAITPEEWGAQNFTDALPERQAGR